MPLRIFLNVIILVFLVNVVSGQQGVGENIPISRSDSTSWVNKFVLPRLPETYKPATFQRLGNGKLIQDINAWRSFPVCTPVAPDLYSRQLSFFCRTEWKIEKATSIPFRFRLGSLQYTDYLECKPNALIR